jgi:hypothetical protein
MDFLATVDPIWVQIFLYGGIALAVGAQVIAYRNSERSRQRKIGMALGIAAIFALAVAGQIASARLTDLVKFVYARG